MNKSISAIILTFNEELHIERCIRELHGVVDDIYIVDSGSTDNTVSLAEGLGAKVYYNKWINYSSQLNWGINNLPINTQWVLRIDCDEYLTNELKNELSLKLPNISEDINGIYIKRRVIFMGKWIKHGGYYPFNMLRIWRRNKAYCEQQWMDEHMKLYEGKSLNFKNDFYDSNLNNLTWWTEKHNNYSLREMFDLLNLKYGFSEYDNVKPKILGSQEERKRWLKYRFSKTPLFIRPFVYFIYRYFFKLGFLDGKEGLIWHFLQGFWYRFLVDSKIFELHYKVGKNKEDLKKSLEKEYKIKF
jgi:glycosyltransferase involved in cell wall biosynthesis